MKIYLLYSTVIIALLCGLTNAHAAQPAGCSLGGAAIAFGVYDPTILIPNDTAGALIYRCSQGDHNIMITLSVGGGTSYLTRRMASGSEQLFYNLYRDAGRQVIWGNGSGGTQAYIIRNPQPNNQDINVPIFGRIPPSQNVGVGGYSDTITVSLNF